MNGTVVAKRYARALLGSALEQKRLAPVRAELAALARAIDATPGAARFLENPRVRAEQKNALLDDVLHAMQASATMRGFLRVVVEKARLNLLHLIQSEFEHMADEATGIVRAKVTAARELDPKSVERLRALIQKRTGRQVRLELAVNPSLIGGAALQMESRVLDASIRARLRLLRDSLLSSEKEPCK